MSPLDAFGDHLVDVFQPAYRPSPVAGETVVSEERLVHIGIMSGKRRNPARDRRSPLFLASAGFLVAWVLLGGNMPSNLILFGALALAGTVLVSTSVIHGGLESWKSLSMAQQIALAFFCLMPLLQLIPLPPSLWQTLPGRALPLATLRAMGQADHWQPITLAYGATLRTSLMCIWLSTFLLTIMQLSTRDVHRLFALVLLLGMLNVLIGFVQIISGGSALIFYPSRQSMFLSGLFANKNHTGLFIAITFLAGYVMLYSREGWNRRWLGLIIPCSLLCVAALLATFSRAGIVLGGVALLTVVLLLAGTRLKAGQIRYTALGIALATVVFLVILIAPTDLAVRSLTRFESVDADLRWSIWHWSWPLVDTYFPIGSGIGTFTTIFPPAERLSWVKPTYVNHVHNDYLEQLIEVGVAAPVFWLFIILALGRPLRLAWKDRKRQSGRIALASAMILFLIAAHSVVDYPLRRPAIAAVAMVALAALLRMGDPKRRLYQPVRHARQTANAS